MLFLLSPAKTLDYRTRVPATVLKKATEPLYVERAAELIEILKKKSPAQIARLMALSPDLSTLNAQRYAAWQRVATAANSKPAALAFDGDVYDGLQAKTLKAADLAWAQQHLVILSGLYGALRPLDRLQPYRLEMGTALKTRHGKDLYAYWGDSVAEHLNQRQAEVTKPVIVNQNAARPSHRLRLRRAPQRRHPGHQLLRQKGPWADGALRRAAARAQPPSAGSFRRRRLCPGPRGFFA